MMRLTYWLLWAARAAAEALPMLSFAAMQPPPLLGAWLPWVHPNIPLRREILRVRSRGAPPLYGLGFQRALRRSRRHVRRGLCYACCNAACATAGGMRRSLCYACNAACSTTQPAACAAWPVLRVQCGLFLRGGKGPGGARALLAEHEAQLRWRFELGGVGSERGAGLL